MEKRKPSKFATGKPPKATDLPLDYLKMVQEVFATHFATGLKAISKSVPGVKFSASGAIFSDEIVLSVTVAAPGKLACTTAHASADFDPLASAPTAETLLAGCVDALASLYSDLLDPSKPDRLEQVAQSSLSAIENVPFHWTPMKVNQREVYLKLDKSNPELERMADDWLEKNDPKQSEEIQAEQEDDEAFLETRLKIGKKDSTH